MSQFEKNFVETNGFKTHYLSAGSGEPLILIHGGGAGADSYGNWRECIPLFAEHMAVYAPDMVGFGHSDCPDPASFTYDADARIDQMIAFIETLNLGPCHIVGNSMGGATALGVGMKRPDLVKNLVLMGSAGLNREVNAALKPVLNYDFTLEGMRRVIEALANPHYIPSEEQLRYRYELSVKPEVKRSYSAIMAWVKEQGGLHFPEEDIAKVKNRTLVFNGKDDLVIPMREAYRFLELLDNSHGYFLPNCRHWAMIEYPQVFTRVTLEFLTNYAGR